PVRVLAFSPDGHFLAVAGDQARVWDCRSHEFVTAELPHPAPVLHLVFNHHGDRLATACPDQQVRVFAVPGSAEGVAPLFPPLPHLGRSVDRSDALAPVFIDQDRGLLTHVEGGAAWWDAVTGKGVRQLPSRDSLNRIVPSSDGRYLVLCGDKWAQLYE